MKLYEFKHEPSMIPLPWWTECIMQTQQLFLDAYKKPYYNGYSFINVPFEKQIWNAIISLTEEKKQLNARMLIVIGIGGSNLGTKAVHEFLHGIYYNDTHPFMKCYFVDTVDAGTVQAIMDCMNHVFMQGGEVLINVISKSGTTTETIIHFNIFLAFLKKKRPDTYRSYIVVTSDQGSQLSVIAQQEAFTLLTIPPTVGGRFSVFTAVGLFPLCMLGIDIVQLCTGAQAVITELLSTIDNDAVSSAYSGYDQCIKGKTIHDMFVFGAELESFGLWYRQLFGESLGKNTTLGITPTVSVGSTDLHSIGQLYLGGPYDKYVTFVSIIEEQDYIFEIQPELQQCTPQLKKNSMQFVKNAIIQGTQNAYKTDKRPFESLYALQKSADAIGQLLQWYMIRVVYMAHLLQLNPFDQPHVELYKRETRKIVSYE